MGCTTSKNAMHVYTTENAHLFAVCGATGHQGGAVASAILKHGGKVRIITRNPESDRLERFKDLGAEVVQADYDSPETLKAAFKDCKAAFCMTNYWEHQDSKKELSQGKALADAAKENKLDYVIWSSLEDTRKCGVEMEKKDGEYQVGHFDAKGEVYAYMKEIELPVVCVNLSLYHSNWINYYAPTVVGEGDDKHLEVSVPVGETPIPQHSIEDLGKLVLGIRAKHATFIGKEIGFATNSMTMKQITDVFTKVLGIPTKFKPTSIDDYSKLEGHWELSQMWRFFTAKEFKGKRNVKESLKICAQHGKIQSFEEWLERNQVAMLEKLGLPVTEDLLERQKTIEEEMSKQHEDAKAFFLSRNATSVHKEGKEGETETEPLISKAEDAGEKSDVVVDKSAVEPSKVPVESAADEQPDEPAEEVEAN